jgi:hypothetical protein
MLLITFNNNTTTREQLVLLIKMSYITIFDDRFPLYDASRKYEKSGL